MANGALAALEGLRNMLHRTWSKAPSVAKSELPGLFHTSPRLDGTRVIAKAAASVPYHLYSKKALRAHGAAADPLDDHELYDILETPCPTFPELDGWTLRFLTFAHRRLTGEFFWLKVRDERGHILSLLPVPAAWVTKKPTVGDHTFLVYPYGETASKALTVYPEDIVWFKDPDLADPYGNGRGSAEAIGDEIETDQFASKYQKNFFYNDAMPPYIVSGDGFPDSQIKQLQENLMQKVAGWMNARKPGIIAGRDVKVTKLAENSRDIDMIESRKFLRDAALQHDNIPPEIFGIVENSNRATIDSAFYLFNKNVLTYDLEAYERTINIQLLAVDYGSDTVLKHEKIVQEDEAFALQVYNAGIDRKLVTRDEWRIRFGFPAMPNPKVGTEFVGPIGTQSEPSDEPEEPAPALASTTTEPADPADPDEQVLDIEDEDDQDNNQDSQDDDILPIDDDEEDDNQDDKDENHDKAIKVKKLKAQQRREALWKVFDKTATAGEPMFEKSVKKLSANQRDKVKAAVKTALQEHADEAAVASALSSVFGPQADQAVKRTLAPAWLEMMKQGNAHALNTLGIGKAYKEESGIGGRNPGVVNQLFSAWIDEHGLEKAKGLNKTTNEKLNKVLVNGLSESVQAGEGIGKIIKKLMALCDDTYDDMDKNRAKTIARTETATAMNFGSFATYKCEGVGKKEWVATMDDRCRDDHSDADTQVVGIDESFTVGDDELQYPGDPAGDPSETINCRCTVSPIVEDNE